MILYNVTLLIAEEKEIEFVDWMKNEHIEEVLATGLFEKAIFSKLLTEVGEHTGVTYAVQYHCPSMEKLQQYYQEFAPTLRDKGLQKFGTEMLGFRTELKVIEEFTPSL